MLCSVCVQCMELSRGSLSMGLKAWMAEGRLGSQSDRAPAPSPWTLPLLWNWKLHK